MIKAITKFFNTDNPWHTVNTKEEAIKDARELVLRKYIRTCKDQNDSLSCKGWKFLQKHELEVHEQRDASDAIRDFIKFYPEIMAELKSIETQPVLTGDQEIV